MDIGARGRDDGVGIRPLAIDHLAIFLQPNRRLRLRVGPFGHRADREQHQVGLVRKNCLDCVERRIHRSVAG